LFRFPGDARLRVPREFDAFRVAPYRASLRWVALSARTQDTGADAPVRFGLVVSKRMARKSAQRNLVKRILREAARHALPPLAEAAVRRHVDVLLRFRSAFPDAEAMPLATFRRSLRAEADQLLLRLGAHLVGGDAR
jgi:ribonuclease P protein component